MKPIDFGSMTLETVSEVERVPIDLGWMFPAAPPDWVAKNRDWLDERVIEPRSGQLVITIQSYVVRTRGRTILVDTCIGNHKERPTLAWMHQLDTAYLENLAGIGLRPEDIDMVLCTHLHADHVGWNTRLVDGRWVPTFPKARYVMGKAEFDVFERLHLNRPKEPVARGAFADSVLPVVASGQADFVDAAHVVERELDFGVWLESMPGHTAGHVGVHVRGPQGHALLTGDAIHHPVQFTALDVVMVSDADRAQAAATRRRLAETYADTDTIILASHFPLPTAGRIVRHRDHFRFRWIDA
jgi:glyoxylase-like metal-dependent hydrolase (beta-lactamase superfamily II)